jgi:hypothetical protein
MNESKPLLGSMFTSSEGIFTVLINGLLANGLMVSDDRWVQITCAAGACIVTCCYALAAGLRKAGTDA